ALVYRRVLWDELRLDGRPHQFVLDLRGLRHRQPDRVVDRHLRLVPARRLPLSARRATAQSTTKLSPTSVSSVALMACSETSQVCSPTTPSAATPPQP